MECVNRSIKALIVVSGIEFDITLMIPTNLRVSDSEYRGLEIESRPLRLGLFKRAFIGALLHSRAAHQLSLRGHARRQG